MFFYLSLTSIEFANEAFAINLFRYKKGFIPIAETLYAVDGPVALAPSSLNLLRYRHAALPMQYLIQCPKINAFRSARKKSKEAHKLLRFFPFPFELTAWDLIPRLMRKLLSSKKPYS